MQSQKGQKQSVYEATLLLSSEATEFDIHVTYLEAWCQFISHLLSILDMSNELNLISYHLLSTSLFYSSNCVKFPMNINNGPKCGFCESVPKWSFTLENILNLEYKVNINDLLIQYWTFLYYMSPHPSKFNINPCNAINIQQNYFIWGRCK